MLHVWIDQDLCTGDGLCTDHCPEMFVILEDGISYVATTAGPERSRRTRAWPRCRPAGRGGGGRRRGLPRRVHLPRGGARDGAGVASENPATGSRKRGEPSQRTLRRRRPESMRRRTSSRLDTGVAPSSMARSR